MLRWDFKDNADLHALPLHPMLSHISDKERARYQAPSGF